MSLDVKVYDNGDHTCIVWIPADGKPVSGCRGFTIKRIKNGQPPNYLHGFVGFSDDDKLDPANPWKFPVQRFMWWDYDVQPNDKVQYSVVPVTGQNKDSLQLDNANASPMTDVMTITGQFTEHISAYFNRGIIATQWVSRALDNVPQKSQILNQVKSQGNSLRNALAGMLLPEIEGLLDDARTGGGSIYAALYELNDPQLIAGLTALGNRCNLILGNGAFKSNTPPNNDENAAVREQLRGKINLFDRIVTKGHFAHNKFVVICDANGKPQKVLTGSTNWTSTGLCTQANNSIIVNDAGVAADYLAAWSRLKEAGNDYPPELVQGNSTAQTYNVDGCKITPWFVKTSKQQDLDFARQLINTAKEGILFLFFNPGVFETDPAHWTLLQNILERHNSSDPNYNGDLYFCGVVNQVIAELTPGGGAKPQKGKLQPSAVLDPSVSRPSPVTLFSNGAEPPTRLSHDVLVPAAIKDRFHDWDQELLGAGIVNIHSKVIVIDPFGANPVVMTGSHNDGFKASSANDDNLMIVQGNAPLAAAYAINIIAIFQTYRWNSYVEAHRNDPRVWHGLVDTDSWQQSYLSGNELAELKFWLAEDHAVAAVAVPSTVAAPSAGAAHSAASRQVAPAHAAATHHAAAHQAAHHPGTHSGHPIRQVTAKHPRHH
ncbi:MAG TPA: phospholipase D-like domain-containing protein [Candidatus Acidoferrum sp.]|jgi:phosphatidylserine/phosphatidylglycerophosphate/cardiolipin synthase-like enzyme|nr:phospholipase D-like domain-containing protein [Candidatus Acidoferrum sp.]